MTREAAAPGRQKAYHRGLRAETWAAWTLRLKGYRIVARRVRTPFGELDLVARRGRCLVFVEVKARTDIATALAAISPRQRQRIMRAAQAYLAYRPGYAALDMRFDLVLLAPRMWPRHIVDAWRPLTAT